MNNIGYKMKSSNDFTVSKFELFVFLLVTLVALACGLYAVVYTYAELLLYSTNVSHATSVITFIILLCVVFMYE